MKKKLTIAQQIERQFRWLDRMFYVLIGLLIIQLVLTILLALQPLFAKMSSR